MQSFIITRVFGGLGNQLFIYAYARALSMRMGTKFLLDNKTGFYKDIYQRSYELHHFNIPQIFFNTFCYQFISDNIIYVRGFPFL